MSGGVDSTTCLAMAVQRSRVDGWPVVAISFRYGQKHAAELDAAERVAKVYGLDHHFVDMPREVFAGGDSTLVEGGPENPTGSYDDLPEGVSPTYVPFRNANLISVAAAICVKSGGGEVWFGAHAEDASRWAYPDCTPEFIGAMACAIYVGTYHEVRLVTPLEWLSKAGVVREGLMIAAPYHLTMSCYNGQRPACGKCPTCLSRMAAFRANGIDDPIAYVDGVEVEAAR